MEALNLPPALVVTAPCWVPPPLRFLAFDDLILSAEGDQQRLCVFWYDARHFQTDEVQRA